MDLNRITDPTRIRALAHPLRMHLLELVGEREMTATECAAATGASVASCAFHLGTLAKYGFVEPAERRGREKPWRAVSDSMDLRPDPEVPGSGAAVGLVARQVLDAELARLRDWAASISQGDPAWVDASTMTTSTFWATREELAEVSASLQAISARFEGRNADPARRPAGARPVRMFAAARPDADRERRAGQPEEA